jgi:hypothetical protein
MKQEPPCLLARQKDQLATRLNDGEVAEVDRGDLIHAEPLRARDHRGIDGTERKITVSADEVGNAQPVNGVNRLHVKGAGCHVAEEPQLGLCAETGGEQVDNLGNDQRGNDQRTGMGLQ